MSKIPLYNCYWCRCAYCANTDCDRLEQCVRCQANQKLFIHEYCDRFTEKEGIVRIVSEPSKIDCGSCEYKTLIESLKSILGKII